MTEMIAFVLSGGASLGAIQAGMLEALFERGARPDLIVGTSAGALNGAFIASREPSRATARELADVWRTTHRGDVFPISPVAGIMGLLGRAHNLVSPDGLRRLITDHLAIDRLEDAAVPVHVVAADVMSGAEVRLSSGPAIDAVLASAAIPGVFPPVEVAGRTLMDGGVANNAPITHAIELGADRVYVLPTGYSCALPQAPRGPLNMALHAMMMLMHQRLVREIRDLAGHARLTVLPPPCPIDVTPIDFDRADKLIDTALENARAFLDAALDDTDARERALPALMPHLHGQRGEQPVTATE